MSKATYERMQDAIRGHIEETLDAPNAMLIDFVVSASFIDPEMGGEHCQYAVIVNGQWHALRGLCSLAIERVDQEDYIRETQEDLIQR